MRWTKQDRLEIAVETVGGEVHPGQPGGYQSTYWFRSTLRMKPDETVEVALKQPPGKTDTFANPNRVFSIRIRARQIR